MPNRGTSGLDTAVAKLIRVIAAERSMKQADIADAAGIPRSTFNRYWSGERSMTLGDLERIVFALGTSYAQEAEDIHRLLAGE